MIASIQKIRTLLSSYRYINLSYSQEGEDLFLLRYFNSKENGFYVDVGAHHPKRFSNTYVFYQLGWKGINIDAMPNSMQLFNRVRSRDINLEVGISKEEGELTYHIFNETALNTFSESEAILKNESPNYSIERKVNVQTVPLSKLLETHLPKDQQIDFLSVDVEGLDLEVIESNDWNKYRPHLVLIEDLDREALDKLNNSPVYQKMKTLNYTPIGRTVSTLIFKDKTR